MSQYPYQPPTNTPYGYGYLPQDPLAGLLAPAKRASIFLFILSGLLLPCGGLMLIYSFLINSASIPPEAAAQMQLAKEQAASLGFTLSGLCQAFAVGAGIPGILFLVLAVVLRRGGIGSAVTTIISSGLLCLVFGFFTFTGVVASAQGQTEGIAMGCATGILLILSICLLVFAIQAARNAGRIDAYRMGYQAQMQQYQQNPGMYQPPGASQQPQAWQQPAIGQWPQPGWPPQQQPPQPPQNWPPSPPSNPT